MAKGDDDWSEDEIRICVDQYLDVLKRGGAKKHLPKDVFLSRAQKQLPKRNEGSVARRMANISHVVVVAGLEPVLGWKPLANVGPTNTARILAMLKDADLIT